MTHGSKVVRRECRVTTLQRECDGPNRALDGDKREVAALQREFVMPIGNRWGEQSELTSIESALNIDCGAVIMR